MSTATRERPIIFSGPMVRAILGGRKTMTRRVIKVSSAGDNGGPLREIVPSLLAHRGDLYDARYDGDNPRAIRCPYGLPGDRLWVRESFYVAEPYSWGTDPSGEAIEHRGVPRGPVHYRADGEPANTPNRHYQDGLRGGVISAPDPYAVWVRRPSIHMPRWASRITLEVAEIRVERLQEISIEEVVAEGFEEVTGGPHANEYWREETGAKFVRLWDQLNAKRGFGWATNPWVWVVSSRRLPDAR